MGELGRMVYLDTNIIIAAIEPRPGREPDAAALIAALETSKIAAVTSTITVMEVLAKPFAMQDHDLADRYREILFEMPALTCRPITAAIAEEAAHLTQSFGLKTADALHGATAISTGCKVFVTEDLGLTLPPAVRTMTLDAFVDTFADRTAHSHALDIETP